MKKMKRKFMAGARGGILTSMILVGAGTAFAQTTTDYTAKVDTYREASGMHMMHRYNSPTKIKALVRELGIPREQIKQELKLGKSVKQILQEYDITMDQLDTASGQ